MLATLLASFPPNQMYDANLSTSPNAILPPDLATLLVATLAPTYMLSPLLPFARVAVHVCVMGSLYPTSSGDSSYTVSVTKHQQKAEREKFRSPSVNTGHTFVNGEMVIRSLNDSHTLLLPFIIDPFGSLGPLANCFLFGIRPDPPQTQSSFKVAPLSKPTKS